MRLSLRRHKSGKEAQLKSLERMSGEDSKVNSVRHRIITVSGGQGPAEMPGDLGPAETLRGRLRLSSVSDSQSLRLESRD